MNIVKFLIPVVVGGIIGYFTNWLAIKMLFRPHEEKYIFGIKVPFTPGLIPKERYRVSKSVGNAVGDYLLTPETIIGVVGDEKNLELLFNWLKEYVLKYEDKNIKELVKNMEESLAIEIVGKTSRYTIEKTLEEITGEKNKKDLIKLIEDLYDSISDKLIVGLEEENLLDLLVREDNKNKLVNFLEEKFSADRQIKELVDEKYIHMMEDFIGKNKEDIHNIVKNILNDEKIRSEIYEVIIEAVDKNVSKLITTFVGKTSIADKIFETIYDYLNRDKTKDTIAYGLNKGLEKLLSLKTLEIKELIHRFTKTEDFDGLVDKSVEFLKDKDVDKFIDKKIVKLAKNKSLEYRKDLVLLAYNQVEAMSSSQEVKTKLEKILEKILYNILDIRLVDILSYIDEGKIYDLMKNFILNIDKSLLESLIKKLNISKIVEEQINSFDVEFGEELILDIAGRELKAITNLGALLGALMGIITPLLQLIY